MPELKKQVGEDTPSDLTRLPFCWIAPWSSTGHNFYHTCYTHRRGLPGTNMIEYVCQNKQKNLTEINNNESFILIILFDLNSRCIFSSHLVFLYMLITLIT